MLLFLKHSSAKKQFNKIKTIVVYAEEKNSGFKKNPTSGKWRGDFAKELMFILKIRQGIMFCFAVVYMGLNTQNG